MKRKNKIQVGQKFHIDSYEVKQYENKRVVDDVEVFDVFSGKTKYVLVYSPKLNANVLVKKTDLKEI